MTPITFPDALNIYSKAKGAQLNNAIGQLINEARVNFVIDEFCTETITALIVLGDKLLDATQALEALVEVNEQMTLVLQARIRDTLDEPIGDAETVVWKGNTHDFTQNSSAIMREIAIEATHGRHPSVRKPQSNP